MMDKEKKEAIQIWSAVGMLAAGVVLVIAGFIVSPTGEVSESVLWFFAQCLIYAGSIFGIGMYVRSLSPQPPPPKEGGDHADGVGDEEKG